MTVEQLEMIASQFRHIDIIEEQLFDAQIQLKKLREDLEDIMTQLIKDNRE